MMKKLLKSQNRKLFFMFGTVFLAIQLQAQTWVGRIGGANAEHYGSYYGKHIAVTTGGNVYSSASYISGATAYSASPSGSSIALSASGATHKIYISKQNIAGEFVWVKTVGTAGNVSYSTSVALDGDENIYITGAFAGTVDFNPGDGTSNLATSGTSDYDIFLLKLDKDGEFVWAKKIGGSTGSLIEEGFGLDIDATGNILLAGHFGGTTDFGGTTSLTSKGDLDGFILKLNSSGDFVLPISWVKQLGGAGTDKIYSLKTDTDNKVYVTGSFIGSNAEFNGSVVALNATGTTADAFVLKLESNGNFGWVKQFSAAETASGYDLTTDLSGNVIITGEATGNTDFGGGLVAGSGVSATTRDMFVVKLKTSDGSFGWALYKGINGFHERGTNIAVDNSDNIYIGGHFGATLTFAPGYTATLTSGSASGTVDAFILKLNAIGEVMHVKTYGSINNDRFTGLAVDETGNIYGQGTFSGATIGAAGVTFGDAGSLIYGGGGWDIFIFKMAPGTLPIVLGNFEGKATGFGNMLVWTTLSERDNSYFEIEKSSNGVDFYFLDRIEGKSHSSVKINYTYLDKAENSVAYYRLKQVDHNGNFTYSDIIEISNPLGNNRLTFYPNPVVDFVSVNAAKGFANAKVKVYDSSGKLIFKTDNINGNTYKIDLKEYNKGVYILEINDEDVLERIKVIKY